MKYYRFIYKVKPSSTFKFNEEGDLLNEVTVITDTNKKALEILDKNYPYFSKEHVTLKSKQELPNIFK